MNRPDVQAAIAQAEHCGELLTRYLERVGMVGEFIGALKLAACEESTHNNAPAKRLHWPALMEGLALLLPADGPVELAAHKTVLALHALSEGADPRGTPPPAPAAGAKRTTRAALAAVATQPQ